MTKITDEELQQIKNTREQLTEISENLSELLLQQVALDDLVNKAKASFIKFVEMEEIYFTELQKKYGEGLLDIETGELRTS